MKEQLARYKEINGKEPTRQEMEDFLNQYGTGEPELVETSQIKGQELKEQVSRFKEMYGGREPSATEMEDFLNEYGTGEFEIAESN